MDLDNMKFNEIIHNKFKKCGFCGKELVPKGLDYLYANISPDAIEYQRCDCEKAQEYWKKIDEQEYETEKRIAAFEAKMSDEVSGLDVIL